MYPGPGGVAGQGAYRHEGPGQGAEQDRLSVRGRCFRTWAPGCCRHGRASTNRRPNCAQSRPPPATAAPRTSCTGSRSTTRGSAENGATYKWSRENGSGPSPSGSSRAPWPTLETLGRDYHLSLKTDDWVEVIDDDYVLSGQPGLLAKVGGISRRHHGDAVGAGSAPAFAPLLRPDEAGRHPLLRRWDHLGDPAAAGALPVVEGTDPQLRRVEEPRRRGADQVLARWAVHDRRLLADPGPGGHRRRGVAARSRRRPARPSSWMPTAIRSPRPGPPPGYITPTLRSADEVGWGEAPAGARLPPAGQPAARPGMGRLRQPRRSAAPGRGRSEIRIRPLAAAGNESGMVLLEQALPGGSPGGME